MNEDGSEGEGRCLLRESIGSILVSVRGGGEKGNAWRREEGLIKYGVWTERRGGVDKIR